MEARLVELFFEMKYLWGRSFPTTASHCRDRQLPASLLRNPKNDEWKQG